MRKAISRIFHRSGIDYLVIIIAVACIFLPRLGDFELRGEEPRRALIAKSMVQTGDYMQPTFGGHDYFKKPPLFNWLIAGLMKITGHMNEITVRLPSILSLIAIAILLYRLAIALGLTRSALPAGIIFLTTATILEKGRLAEIEMVITLLCFAAIACWLKFQHQQKPWAAWIAAGVFLGAAALTKGPTCYLYFYPALIAYCIFIKRRAWLHPGHLVMLLLSLGIFMAWYLPNDLRIATASSGTSTAWQSEVKGLFEVGEIKSWLSFLPEFLVNLLPWVLFLFLLKKRNNLVSEHQKFVWVLLWSIIPVTLLYALIPRAHTRYLLPLIPLFALAVAILICELPQSTTSQWHLAIRRFIWIASCLIPIALITAFFIPSYHRPVISALAIIMVVIALWLVKKQASSPWYALPFVFAAAWIAAGNFVLHNWNKRAKFQPPAKVVTELLQLDTASLSDIDHAPRIWLWRQGESPFAFYLGAKCYEVWHTDDIHPQTGDFFLASQAEWVENGIELEKKLGNLEPVTYVDFSSKLKYANWKIQPMVWLRQTPNQ